MSNLESAFGIYLMQLVDSYPKDVPKHNFSDNHNKKMNTLKDKMRNDKYHSLTRNMTRLIIVAAIILSMTITVLAVPQFREFTIKHFNIDSSYFVNDTSDVKSVEDFVVGYIPNGFEMTETNQTYDGIEYTYTKGNEYFFVEKTTINNQINFDTEENPYREIEENGQKYIVYKPSDTTLGIFYNNGEYIYSIYGNINEEQQFAILKSAK